MAAENNESRKQWGFVPYLWLVYMIWIFVIPIRHSTLRNWAITAAGMGAFLPVYLRAWSERGRRLQFHIAAIMIIGAIWMPFNQNAFCLYIYAASFLPYAMQPPRAMAGIGAVMAWNMAQAYWLRSPWEVWIPSSVLIGVIGAANIHFAQRRLADCKLRMAQEEIERLAQLAERERISRDLHDVLGHTLSVVILKSDLAARLSAQDPERARQEMQDVAATARQALADVRAAIRGDQDYRLAHELDRAKMALLTAGVSVDVKTAVVDLPPTHEPVLALALREAATNVIRHANATTCHIEIAEAEGHYRLRVEDNGRGCTGEEGNGLKGMRARLQAIGGTVMLRSDRGTCLIAECPAVAAAAASKAALDEPVKEPASTPSSKLMQGG